MNAELLGRDGELLRIASWLDAAATGSPAVGFVVGEAGIGKSTLVSTARAMASARGFQVLATQGRSADTEIGFSSLLTLLRPWERELDERAGDAAGDLRAALALGRRDADPVGVSLGVFRVVASLADGAPVLVCVDDADLLDAASARALAFALGRLDADPVCAILAGEGPPAGELGALQSEQLTVGPLDARVLAAVVAGHVELDAAVLDAVVRLASGNPLAGVELARSLSEDERRGAVPFAGVPRPSAAMKRGFEARLAVVPEAARRALAVVAADDTGDVAVITAALERLGEDPHGLGEAEACGLLVREGARVRLVHPLLRAVAYHQVAAASRRAAHRALAAALERPDQAAARAWQLAAAVEGPDEAAAGALALVADDAERRGGPTSAARILEHSAAITPDAVVAQARRAGAARLWFESDPERARAIAARIGPPLDADVAAVLAGIGLVALDAAPSGQEHEFAAMRAEQALRRGDRRAAAALASSVLDARASGACSEPAAVLAEAVLVELGLASGDRAPRTPGEGAFARRAWQAALDARVAAGYVDAGPPGSESDVASALRRARVDLLQGRARAAADRLGGRVALRAGAGAVVLRAEADLLLGRRDRAAAGIDDLVARAEQEGDARTVAHGSWLLGRATGRASWFERAAAVDPGRYGADAVAVLAGAGRCGEARAAAERLGEFEHAGPLMRARVLRARATAGLDRCGFEVALAICDEHGLVVEAIETLLASGATADARARARMTDLRYFDAPAIDAGDGPRLRDRLSAAELRVAEAVASGLTNRQAADSLFLSVKTVDFHLQQIYRKLGVRTRTQLAVLVSRDAAFTPEGSA